MSPDARTLVLEIAEVLEHQPHLEGPDLAASLEPRLEQLVAGLAPSLLPIRRKLFALRGWLDILRQPGAVQHHGGTACIRSFLLADCSVLACMLVGPPDPEPDEAPSAGAAR